MPSGPFPTEDSTIPLIPLGVDGKCYRTVSAAYDTEMVNVSGAGVKRAKNPQKITRKGTGRRSLTISGILDESVDFILRNVRTDEAGSQEVAAILAAFDFDLPIDLMFLDGKKTDVNAIGFAGFWNITKCDRNEDDPSDIHYACTAEPAEGTAKRVRTVFIATGGVVTDLTAPVEE